MPVADVDGCAVTAGDGRRHSGESDDRAWQPAPPGLDLLVSPADEPREPWLRQALDRSGALTWPGRHRLLLSGLAALLVVVAIGVEYVVTRPPPMDPTVDVGVVGFDAGPSSSDFDSQGRVRAKLSYQLTAHAAGDVVTAVGVVGPGLTNPTSTISAVTFGHPLVGTLGATVDCSAPTWWTATDTNYRARVRRTDTYGRVTTYDAPLGDSNASWHNGVRGTCLRSFFEALPEATASASAVPRNHVVKVTLRLTNPSRHDLWVLPATFAEETVTGGGSFVVWTPLPAGGSASVTTSLHAADCSSGTPPQVPFAKNLEGVPGNDRALPVYLSDTKLPEDWQTAGAWAHLEPASATGVDRQLAALCPSAH